MLAGVIKENKNTYKVNTLAIEITRKCNLKCFHCMRGEQQNLSMSKAIIDRIFKCIPDCEHVAFTGGEPLLEIDLIDYFLDSAVKNNWNIKDIQITTNATIKDKKIIDIYKHFCNSTGGCALLRISDDDFHNKENSKAAYEYYKKLVDLANKELNRTAIYLEYVSDDANLINHLVYSGRAIDYINNNKSLFTPLGKILVRTPYLVNHRIKICDNTIICSIQISANGNVGLCEDRDYKNIDKLSFGNILESDFTSIINDFNAKCLLNCSDMDLIDKYCQTVSFAPGIREEGRICFSIFGDYLNKIVKTRLFAQELYSLVPAQDILTYITFPKDVNEVPVRDIYNKYNQLPKVFVDLDAWLFLKTLLGNDELFVLPTPNLMLGTKEELMETHIFKRLDYLNQQYYNKKLIPKNNKVFICEGS